MSTIEFIAYGRNGRIVTFPSAEAAAMFLWGKDVSHWTFFVRVDNLPSDITKIERALDSSKAITT